jgi:hypothetical protein
MMSTVKITLTIDIPDGSNVSVDTERSDADADPIAADPKLVEEYWSNYLSDNGRRLYRAAALLQKHQRPFTLSELAQAMSITYESVQSYHRTSGRSARKWRDDCGLEAPIVLEDLAYRWVPADNGMRTTYQLPSGVAELIVTFPG